VLEAHLLEVIGDEVGRGSRIGIVLGKRPDARDAEQVEVVGQTLVPGALEKRVKVGEVSFADL
jgi:hypothetical protein